MCGGFLFRPLVELKNEACNTSLILSTAGGGGTKVIPALIQAGSVVREYQQRGETVSWSTMVC